MAPNALVPTSVCASTGVALPGVGAVPQRGTVLVGTLSSAGATQPQLPGSEGAKEILVVRIKCWSQRMTVPVAEPLFLVLHR